MSTIKRLETVAVVAGVGLSLLAGCRRTPSTASRSAAAYDEAQRRGTPVGGSGAHGDHAPSPAAGGTGGPAGASYEQAHGEHAAAASSQPRDAQAAIAHGHAAGGAAPRRGGGMDHAAMGHATSPGPARSASVTTGHTDHAAMGHAAPPGTAHPMGPAKPMDHAAMGHGTPAAVDHAAMGHSASPMPPSSPEPATSKATPGQPAATLRTDGLDSPTTTSVEEAARAAAMAAAGHTMSHGTYRQMDAGRPSPSPKENR